MGILELFREWQQKRNPRFHGRRRFGVVQIEPLEFRRMLSPVLTGTTLNVTGTTAPDVITVNQDTTTGVTVTVDNVTTNYAAGITINAINIVGGPGDNQITINNILSSTALTIEGGGGTNTLISQSQANTWLITGPNSGTLNGSSFSNIQNLVGGGFTDNFEFGSSGFVAGTIDGGAGVNILNYSQRNVGAVVDLANDTATAVGGGFTNINSFDGSTDNTDLLIGMNQADVWHITSGNTGDLNGSFFFAGVENLTGGSVSNSFVLESVGFEGGTISGGGGVSTLDYSTRTTDVVTNLAADTSTAIGAGFNEIGTIIGSSSSGNILTGANYTNTWNILSGNAGTVTNAFSSTTFQAYDNLVGGTVADTFYFSPIGFVSGSLSGGGGNNTLNYSSRTAGIVMNLQTGSTTAIGGQVSNIQNVVGSSGTDNLLIGANTTNDWNITGANSGNVNGLLYFTGIENLLGGTMSDAFHFQAVGFVAGGIDGGLGANTLDYSQRQVGVVVNLQTETATAVGGGFQHISSVIGATQPPPGFTPNPDTLIGPNTLNNWNITGVGSGVLNNNFTFASIQNITGGNSVNVYHVLPGGSITGILNGGAIPAGAPSSGNWLDYSALTTPVTVNLSTGTATGFGQIQNIQNVAGSNGSNSLTGNSIGNVLVGGNATDTLNAGSGRSLLIGGLGSDTIHGGAGQDILIGGYTNYDSNGVVNFAALGSILAEWQSSDSLTTRFNDLRNGGGLNGSNTLVADGTVHNDEAVNAIFDGTGSPNWLWGQPAELQNKTAQDIVNTPIANNPVISGATNVVYTVNKNAVAVANAIQVSNTVVVANATNTLASATVRITGNYNSGQDNLGFTSSAATGNITAAFNTSNGTLTLTSAGATATVAQFQLALRQVVYWNTSATPSLAPRALAFQVFDGTNYSLSIGSSLFFNYAPVLSGTSSVTFPTGGAPVPINTAIGISAVNNIADGVLSYATVQITRTYTSPEDVLGFISSAATGNIAGSFNAATGTLTLTSAGSTATVAQFQAALRLVTYQDTSLTPLEFTRYISYQVSDGYTLSNLITSTVSIS